MSSTGSEHRRLCQTEVWFVGYARDGMISRAYEYFDTGPIETFLGPSS